MPSLLPIILTASQVVLAADQLPKFDVERTCRLAAIVGLPGRDAAACQRDENDARTPFLLSNLALASAALVCIESTTVRLCATTDY